MNTMMRVAVAAGLALAAFAACARDATGPHGGLPGPTDSPGPGIAGTTTVNGKPAFTLDDGKVVELDDMAETEEWLQRYPPPAASVASLVANNLTLPASVSLKAYQTPVRDQGGRGTCTLFASLAAMEAEYNRTYGVSLDLSEEYAVLMHNLEAFTLPITAPSSHEDLVATWGGGSVGYALQLFSSGKFGVADEGSMAYSGDANFESTTQQGDMPFLGDNSSQRAVDDFNLSATFVTYKIPSPRVAVIFPRWALDSAKYRPTQVLYASASDLQSVTWFKTQLAAGHEVAFGTSLTRHSPVTNGVWMPGDTVYAGHAMLMVGYSDSLNAFLVKNSWGTGWQNAGYGWFSYDWLTTQVVAFDKNKQPYKKLPVYEAAVVLAVAPPNSPPPAEQRALGRWYLDHDGVQGILDIYRVPGLFGQIQGASDYRVGTYYGPDNVGRRVNGTIVGNQLELYIDWANSGARPIDDLSGLHLSGSTIMDAGTAGQLLSGSLLDNRDGQTYGFYGYKPDYFQPTPTLNPPGLFAYAGSWQMNFKGTWGRLRITSVDTAQYRFSGSFTDGNQQTSAVSGLVSAVKPYQFSMLVGNAQVSGYMFNQERGVLAGNGFVAYHKNHPPTIQIGYPSPNQTLDFDLNLLSGTALNATVSDFEDLNACCAVEWKEGANTIATGASTTYAFSDTGSHTVTAIVTDLDGATAQASVTFRLVNNPPTAKILKPTAGEHFITGITYNDRVEAQTWLTGPGKVITYTWTSSDGSDNFPKSGAKPTNVVFGTPGPRTLTVTVADNYGLQAQASVNVVVDTQPTAPVISFITPLDQDNIQSLTSDTLLWVNIQVSPSNVQGRVYTLVWQGDTQNCVEQTITLLANFSPPLDAKQVWGFWNMAPFTGACFGLGVNGYLRLYVTDPNVATQMAQVRLYNPLPPH